MRMALVGVASLASLSFGCSSAPSASRSSLNGASIAVTESWARTVARQFTMDDRRLPPGVLPPNPILHRDGEAPTNPRAPGCALCPAPIGARLDREGWMLVGRPDPVGLQLQRTGIGTR